MMPDALGRPGPAKRQPCSSHAAAMQQTVAAGRALLLLQRRRRRRWPPPVVGGGGMEGAVGAAQEQADAWPRRAPPALSIALVATPPPPPLPQQQPQSSRWRWLQRRRRRAPGSQAGRALRPGRLALAAGRESGREKAMEEERR